MGTAVPESTAARDDSPAETREQVTGPRLSSGPGDTPGAVFYSPPPSWWT